MVADILSRKLLQKNTDILNDKKRGSSKTGKGSFKTEKDILKQERMF